MKTGTFIKRFARQSALKGLPRPILKNDALQKLSDDEFDQTKFLLSIDPSPTAKMIRDHNK